MINLRLDGVARTLILTLRARADEQAHASPLLDDHWSADWYASMPETAVLDDWYNPNFQLATVIRSRLIDEAVTAFIEKHENPLIVELGAGFSTRYFRLGEGKSTWIELDLGEAISARRKLDTDVDEHWFIGADVAKLNWMDLLPDFDAKNILFIAEGMLMFLDEAVIDGLFSSLSEHFAGASFIFDVVNPDYVAVANEAFTEMDAPMHWGVYADDLDKYPMSVQNMRYLLLEFPDRWDEIGVDKQKRNKKRSGFVVEATLG